MKTRLISATLGALLLTGSTMAMADRDGDRRGDWRVRDRGADLRGHDARHHRDARIVHDVRRDWHPRPHYRHHPHARWHGHHKPYWHRGYAPSRYSYYAPYRYDDRGAVTIILRSTIR
jgi:hypothetical protein